MTLASHVNDGFINMYPAKAQKTVVTNLAAHSSGTWPFGRFIMLCFLFAWEREDPQIGSPQGTPFIISYFEIIKKNQVLKHPEFIYIEFYQ